MKTLFSKAVSLRVLERDELGQVIFVNAAKKDLQQFQMPDDMAKLTTEIVDIAGELDCLVHCKAGKGDAKLNYLSAEAFSKLVKADKVEVVSYQFSETTEPNWRPEMRVKQPAKPKRAKAAAKSKPGKVSRYG